MNSDQAILRADHVSKAYPAWTAGERTLRAALTRRVPLRHRRGAQRIAVDDVSLAVGPGESMGLIGGNGAGKSTLLRIIAGVTRATAGTVVSPPDTAAVLTLGEAFALDLTGADNAITTAVVSGFSPVQARQRLPAILAFAELEDAADRPVRTYSEGMKLRLAFGVVAQLEPEAFVLDEVMAVGDLAFQQKSHEHIRRSRERGAAVLFASHDLQHMRTECDRVVWLDHGKARRIGPPDEVIDEYQALMMDETARRTPSALLGEGTPAPTRRLGSQEARAEDVTLSPVEVSAGVGVAIRSGDPLALSLRLEIDEPLPSSPVVSVVVVDDAGTRCCALTSAADGVRLPRTPGHTPLVLRLDRLDLAPGRYHVEVGVYREDWQYAYDFHDAIYRLDVTGQSVDRAVLAPPHSWTVES